MKIHIDELPDDGLMIDFTEQTPWAADVAAFALDGEVDRLAGHLRVVRLGPGVQVEGPVEVVARRRCDRCLAELRYYLDGTLSLFFDRYPDLPELEIDLLPDELDVGFLEGDELDLSAVLSEYITLEAPSRLFCGDRATQRVEPGVCGLASGQAPETKEVDPRFSSLKEVEFD